MNRREGTRLAIIGGGAAAALVLANLARGAAGDPRNFSIDVYDRAGRFARGVAYSTERTCHLLNVRAQNMSALESQKDHFAQWAGARGYDPSDFVPRALYGDYLDELWAEAEKTLSVRKIRADVESSRAAPGGFMLEVDGESRLYHKVVLACGNVRALAPHVRNEGVGGLYYADPWGIDGRVKQARRIALIGAGLTAVDAILSLRDEGFSGEIVIFSRHAVLPHVHANPEVWSLEPFLIKPGDSPLHVLRCMRAEVLRAAGAGISWRAVIDALRPLTNDLWQGFSARQKASFQRHLYTVWGVHRHRMAPMVAKAVEDARLSGRLHTVRHRVSEIRPAEECDKLKLVLQDGSTDIFDAAVNCMGYRYDEPGRNYEVSLRIGPARFGELFETTAIPEVRGQAARLDLL